MNDIFFLYLRNADTYAIIDEKHKDKVLSHRYTWFLHRSRKNNYVSSHRGKKLHQLILGKYSDHIDANGLNNLESNLRKLSNGENVRRAKLTNSLHNIYRQINKYHTVYRVIVRKKNKNYFLGAFLDLDTAITTRDTFYKENTLCQN